MGVIVRTIGITLEYNARPIRTRCAMNLERAANPALARVGRRCQLRRGGAPGIGSAMTEVVGPVNEAVKCVTRAPQTQAAHLAMRRALGAGADGYYSMNGLPTGACGNAEVAWSRESAGLLSASASEEVAAMTANSSDC